MAERLYQPVSEPYVLPPVLEPFTIPELLTPAEFALNKKQRDWVLDRDGHRCQATCRHRCNPKDGLEVDHIMPQRYAYELGIDPDFSENVLSKCKNAHNIKHPDRIGALRNYGEAKRNGGNSFQDMFNERNEKLAHRQIYWNDENDRTDLARAVQLTQKAARGGFHFPEKKHDD